MGREGFVDQVRAQAEGVQYIVEHACLCCTERDQEDWCVHHSRYLQVEDTHQASYASWEAGNFRQSRHGQGKASQDHCESLPGGSDEKDDLSLHRSVFYLSVRHSILAVACVSAPDSA